MSGILEPLLPYHGYLVVGLRIVLAAGFLAHATLKVGKNMAGSKQWMSSMGIPVATVYMAATLELVGGIFLIVGLIVPIVAFLIAVEMIATTWLKKAKMGGSLLGQGGKPSYENDLLYLVLAIILIVLGAGPFSIDGALGL